jgi:16S rRNA (guanine(966)-N(2))-methyltransferase RsmD
MRVIAGTSRGRRLATFAGRNVRPTPDRVREALFSILQSKMGSFAGVRVLDLFAGSGALAIEALSRGAASALLVDKAAESIRIIGENLERCRLADKARVLAGDAWQALQGMSSGTFDLVFIDPPYGLGLAERAVIEAGRLELLSEKGILCVETAAGDPLPESAGRLRSIDRRRYGSVVVNFYSYSTGELT